jgi:serine/threonine protein kinase
MSLSELLAEARRQRTPAELERFLEEKCGTDRRLWEEIRRRLAEPPLQDTQLQGGAGVTPGCGTVDARALSIQESEGGQSGEADLSINELVADRFKIRERLGAGGMGQVYVADQLEPVKRRVALKVIKAGMDSAQILARFAQERQTLALMTHPNIARIYDGGLTRLGRPYFVMELVEGLPLTKYCDNARLDVRERLALFIPICQAVQHAHQKGIVHRDLKPSNILVGLDDGKPVPKIIDFGVAKALNRGVGEESIYTSRDALVGTLEYMAPEQARLTDLDIDTRADIYSLGVVLYELLCGSLPFSRRDQLKGGLDEIIRIIREVEPRKPSTRLTEGRNSGWVAAHRQLDLPRLQSVLKGDLDWVVMKCLEKERDRRYASAAGLAADLQRYLHKEPVLAAPPSARYRLKKFIQRHWGEVALAAAALVVLLAAMTAATVGWLRAQEAEKLARHEAERARQAEKAARDEAGRALRAERLARDEAAVHQALTAFIQQDLFDAVDPGERAKLGLPLDSAVQLRTLVDRAAERLDQGRFGEQPLLEAALRYTLAKAYMSIGLFEPALKHAERSATLRLEKLGEQHQLYVEALVLIGSIHHDDGKVDQAQSTLQRALALRQSAKGGLGPEVVDIRFLLASVLRAKGQYAEAETMLREVALARERILGRDNERTLETRRVLGDVLLKQGRLDEAEALLTSTLKACRSALGKDHPCTLATLNTLGGVYFSTARVELAMPLYRELVESGELVYGSDHPMVAVFKNNLATCYSRQGDYERALPILQAIEPIFARIGKDHFLTLTMNRNLARAYAKTGETNKALRVYEEIVPRYVELFTKEHPESWKVQFEMAEACAESNQPGRAVELLEPLLLVQRSTKPYDDRAVGSTAICLAKHLATLNQTKRAITILTEVAAEMPQDSPQRALLRKQLGILTKDP